MSSAEKTVVITGAAGGLGRALADEFTRQLWNVAAASRQMLDVTDSNGVRKFISEIIERHGRIDCLVNNAGVTADSLLSQMSDEEWERVLNVNLRGAFLCARAAARQMAKQRDGHIITISSFGARRGPAGQANYAAAKAGLVGLTQSLAKELGSRNVRANTVFPGVMPTGMTAKMPAGQLKELAEANALGRINSVEEVARFIVFLASTQNISGQVFQLDSRIAPWT
jgi:3-oxoacyl-[acyl-carrier protein] reductase